MKKRIISILCVLALLCSGICVQASDSADFRYRTDAEGVTLTAYLGDDASPVIPSEIDGKPVTAIGDGCFRGLLCLKKVRIPEGIVRIGDYAFECCGALEKVYFPDSLTAIGAGAFSGCGALTLADLGEGVERIGRGAFLCCDSLVYLDLPASLETLGEFAFAHCSSLAQVRFRGKKLAALPDRAFYGCEALTSIRLPESIRTVGKRAFSRCTSLRRFYFGPQLDSVGAYAFEHCESLAGADFKTAELPEGIFQGCDALDYLMLAEGTARIRERAFFGSGMSGLSLPASVAQIDEGAFFGAHIGQVSVDESNGHYRTIDGSLYTADGKTLLAYFPADPYAEEPETAFALPEGVETIAAYAFAECRLEHVTLPDSLREIRAYAFAGTDIQDMTVPSGCTVDPEAFSSPGERDAVLMDAVPTTVQTVSAAGDRSLFREEDYKTFHTVDNADFDAWCDAYLAFAEAQGSPIRQELIPYIMRYKGEIIPHFMPMTAVQNHDPDMWRYAANFFGDDFEQMYLMMNHGLFTELRRGKMNDDLILYSGVYDSQLQAAAGMTETPTQQQLVEAIGNTFSDPVMISTTTDPAVACGFGETLFIIYASRQAMDALGAVCIDAVAHSQENEILMSANARYRILDVGDMTVTHQAPWDDEPTVEQRSYVRVELLGPENPFEDVAEDAYYYDAVRWALDAGVTAGTTANTFRPDAGCTRAQAVTFLWRAAGCPEPEQTAPTFGDVARDAYYCDAVRWAAGKGITRGTGENRFSPDKACTRAEVVTFLYRSANASATDAENPFADVPAGSYYADAVVWAAAGGVTKGVDETHFAPERPCTRAQIVTFLYRHLV